MQGICGQLGCVDGQVLGCFGNKQFFSLVHFSPSFVCFASEQLMQVSTLLHMGVG